MNWMLPWPEGVPRRIYRGLKERYRPGKRSYRGGLPPGVPEGVNFTDCPLTALAYAHGRNGVVLVVDAPEGCELRLTEELWLGQTSKRLMAWSPFDQYIAAEIPAKELRTVIRQKGMGKLSDEGKSRMLELAITERLGLPPTAPYRCSA